MEKFSCLESVICVAVANVLLVGPLRFFLVAVPINTAIKSPITKLTFSE